MTLKTSLLAYHLFFPCARLQITTINPLIIVNWSVIVIIIVISILIIDDNFIYFTIGAIFRG